MFIYCVNPDLAFLLKKNGSKCIKEVEDTNGKKAWVFKMDTSKLPSGYELQSDYFVSSRLTF